MRRFFFFHEARRHCVKGHGPGPTLPLPHSPEHATIDPPHSSLPGHGTLRGRRGHALTSLLTHTALDGGTARGGSGWGPGWGGRSGEPVRPQEGTCITEHRLRGSARLVGGTQLPRRLAVAYWWSAAFHVLGGSVSSHTGGGDLGSGLQACYPPPRGGGPAGVCAGARVRTCMLATRT